MNGFEGIKKMSSPESVLLYRLSTEFLDFDILFARTGLSRARTLVTAAVVGKRLEVGYKKLKDFCGPYH